MKPMMVIARVIRLVMPRLLSNQEASYDAKYGESSKDEALNAAPAEQPMPSHDGKYGDSSREHAFNATLAEQANLALMAFLSELNQTLFPGD
jgi:hypothetical protein